MSSAMGQVATILCEMVQRCSTAHEALTKQVTLMQETMPDDDATVLFEILNEFTGAAAKAAARLDEESAKRGFPTKNGKAVG